MMLTPSVLRLSVGCCCRLVPPSGVLIGLPGSMVDGTTRSPSAPGLGGAQSPKASSVKRLRVAARRARTLVKRLVGP